MVEEQGYAEFSEKSGGLARQLSIRDPVLYALILERRRWHRQNCFGPSKGRSCLYTLVDRGVHFGAWCNGAVSGRTTPSGNLTRTPSCSGLPRSRVTPFAGRSLRS